MTNQITRERVKEYVDSAMGYGDKSMPDIDWSKPVEYECYGIVRPIHATFIAGGIRYAVVEGRHGYHVQNVANISGGTFRNMRRKVKHRKIYWIRRTPHGEIYTTDMMSVMESWKRLGYDVVGHVEEWEADADE